MAPKIVRRLRRATPEELDAAIQTINAAATTSKKRSKTPPPNSNERKKIGVHQNYITVSLSPTSCETFKDRAWALQNTAIKLIRDSTQLLIDVLNSISGIN